MEAENIIIDACSNLLIGIAEQEYILPSNIGVRVDLEKENSKPILSVFDKAKHIKRITVKELAKASGVGVMSGMINMTIGKIVQSIFKYGMQQYNVPTTKELFLLIHLKHIGNNVQPNTAIALYVQRELKETKLLSDILSEAQNS